MAGWMRPYANALNVLEAGDLIGAMTMHAPVKPIERPVPITRTAVRTTRFPPCAICARHVMDCECDPDEAMGAAIVAQQNLAEGRA